MGSSQGWCPGRGQGLGRGQCLWSRLGQGQGSRSWGQGHDRWSQGWRSRSVVKVKV